MYTWEPDLYRNHPREDDRSICSYPETAAHFFYECNTYNILRNRTIATITVLTNVEILLSGCPLYDNDANEEIFAQVHNFIINILIKWQYNMPTYLCNKHVHNMNFCRWPVLYSSLSPRKTGYIVAFSPGEIWLYSSLSSP